MAIGMGGWCTEALRLRVLSSRACHCCPCNGLHIAPGLWLDQSSGNTRGVQQDVRWVVGFQAQSRQGCLSQTWRRTCHAGWWAAWGGPLHLLKGLLVAMQMGLFGAPSRVEGNGKSQLRGDALDGGADPRTTGGCGLRRLVLILSITGCPPPEWGWGLCRLPLPSLNPCYPMGYQPFQVQRLFLRSSGGI